MPVKVKTLVEDLGLEVIIRGSEETEVFLSDINRPGLQFAGFYSYFANERIQIVGKTEWSFLDAMRCNTWLVRSSSTTTRFISKVMNYLDDKLAPETRMHGVLVDVYGFGILITGESGIGKSETALELIKRGHRLIADDAVDIKAIEGVLHAKSPFITSGMLEVRGMGIIDVPALYGLSSVLETKTIDLVMYLEQWREGKDYDRLGIDNECIEILNVPVRKMTLPIRPGRNLAVIIEAAAANYRYGLSCKVSPVETINHRMDVGGNE
ncbi:HPr(Ser) kinase/phosphatase [Clostridium sp.]|uniref:HPr(Ser) kinase/phosphatase n=1 Tax=Clostridium sp. TaxID=1506 RepID=UPI00258443D0|nr:HPr(Ser) kinase/phosphatase [Clostridium sp.]